jgi:hypothetical protein
MSTGITSLSKLSEVTAAYPFHGMEVAFTLVILAFFVIFFIWQISMEAKHHSEIIGNFTASPDPATYEEEAPAGAVPTKA